VVWAAKIAGENSVAGKEAVSVRRSALSIQHSAFSQIAKPETSRSLTGVTWQLLWICYCDNDVNKEYKVLLQSVLIVALLMALAAALYFTAFCWWAAMTPVAHPEIYRDRGTAFFALSVILAVTTGAVTWRTFRSGTPN